MNGPEDAAPQGQPPGSPEPAEPPAAPPPVPPPVEPPPAPPASPPLPGERPVIYGPPLQPRREGHSPVVVVALAVALVASLAGNGILAVRLRNAEDASAELRGRAASLQQEVDRLSRRARSADPIGAIADAVEQLRGLRFESRVKPELLGRRAFVRRFLGTLREEFPPAEAKREEKLLKLVGLLKPDDDWYGIVEDLYREQVAAFYDSDVRRIVVPVDDARKPTPLERTSLAHEFVHALADQHYDLDRDRRLYDAGKTDQSLAFNAFVEGEAYLVQTLYQQQELTAGERRQFLQEARRLPTERLDAAPGWVRRALLFPGTKGLAFAVAVFGRGGSQALDDVYEDPPVSSEQIMHPGKYTGTRDDPVKISLPDVRGRLGARWKKVDTSEVGEFDVEIMVDRFLSSTDATEAAGGWDGGHAVVLESSRGTMMAALTAWDTEADAREATEHLGRWLPLRFGNTGSNLDVGGAGRGWQSDDGAGLVIRSGKQVLFVVGPDAASVRRTRGAFEGF